MMKYLDVAILHVLTIQNLRRLRRIGIWQCRDLPGWKRSGHLLIPSDILSKILPEGSSIPFENQNPPSLKDIICIFFAVQGNHSHTHGLPIVLHQKCDSKAKDQPEQGIIASPQTKSISSLSTGRNWVWIKSKKWRVRMENNWKWFDANFWATNLPILPMSKLKCWAFWESYPNPNRVNHHFAWHQQRAPDGRKKRRSGSPCCRLSPLAAIRRFDLPLRAWPSRPKCPGWAMARTQSSLFGGDQIKWTVKDYDILWYICMFRLGHLGTTIII